MDDLKTKEHHFKAYINLINTVIALNSNVPSCAMVLQPLFMTL